MVCLCDTINIQRRDNRKVTSAMDTTIPQDSTPRKQCNKCDQWHPATTEFFSRGKSNPDGFDYRCKKCRSQKWRDDHPKKELPEGYKQCTECKELLHATTEFFEPSNQNSVGLRPSCRQCRAKDWKTYNDAHVKEHKEYYQENKESIASKNKHHYNAHQKQIRDERKRKWHSHNEHFIAMQHKRRAHKRSIPGTLTSQQIQSKLKAQKHKCYYCHRNFEKKDGKYIYHLEHTIPLSRSEYAPRHDINFVVLACPTCNLRKNNKAPWEWVEGGRLF